MNKEQAIRHIRSSSLAKYADALIETLRPSIRLNRRKIDATDAALGASRFGGDPDLPDGFEWPTWEIKRRRGLLRREVVAHAHLDFMAQVRLSDLPACAPEECPRDGLLYVFYDTDEQPWGYEPHHRPGSRVIYYGGPDDSLRRTAPPGRASKDPHVIEAVEEWILPDYPAAIEDDSDAEDYMENLIPALADGSVMHRMFGYPQCIQDEEELWDGDPNGNVLLMQIDTDVDRDATLQWMWGDAGRLFFMIRRDELVNRRFENVRVILQCY